eukprot:TRINITY_DN56727_c0_g1_i1.p1 TRINITY_DN56727_c0_g1~~TRINITY_DN56727_c0_g1_i1.p1  ORF type:complete len:289 (-),score=29.24 TRINITY_DN56727_c0_g1_i1:20-841(-)
MYHSCYHHHHASSHEALSYPHGMFPQVIDEPSLYHTSSPPPPPPSSCHHPLTYTYSQSYLAGPLPPHHHIGAEHNVFHQPLFPPTAPMFSYDDQDPCLHQSAAVAPSLRAVAPTSNYFSVYYASTTHDPQVYDCYSRAQPQQAPHDLQVVHHDLQIVHSSKDAGATSKKCASLSKSTSAAPASAHSRRRSAERSELTFNRFLEIPSDESELQRCSERIRVWTNDRNVFYFDCSCDRRKPTHDVKKIKKHLIQLHRLALEIPGQQSTVDRINRR